MGSNCAKESKSIRLKIDNLNYSLLKFVFNKAEQLVFPLKQPDYRMQTASSFTRAWKVNIELNQFNKLKLKIDFESSLKLI